MTSNFLVGLDLSAWYALLASPDAVDRLNLTAIYGGDLSLCEERRQRMLSVIQHYQTCHGDGPVRLFRAPGRINLRGMHVDTHGGWLNLMTHHREILIAAGPSRDGSTRIVNTDPAFSKVHMEWTELPEPAAGESWSEFISSPAVRGRLTALPGHWRNYLEGAWLRARHAFPDREISGLQMVVDSNLPQGASLSSSAALCIALMHAWMGWHDCALDDDARILAAQDAEWYTGSRCGTCDQAAIVLGQPGAIIHAALFSGAFTTAGARAIPLPEALRVLVINSYTTRSISGAQKVAYTTNRFAYSMAMEIFQQTVRAAGYPEAVAGHCDRLARITAKTLGGHAALFRLLKRIPDRLSMEELRQQYHLPGLDAEYVRYFGGLPAKSQPDSISLRGPLLFGIAESGRAHHFATALEAGEYTLAGQYMTSGHEGDRRVDRVGNLVQPRTDDAYLDQLAACETPIEQCPGAYGASSPALDMLVDAALDHGALGASLTGAGIAGTVLALCRVEDTARVTAGLRETMATAAYEQRAGLAAPLSPAQRAEVVVENHACAGAGEIVPAS